MTMENQLAKPRALNAGTANEKRIITLMKYLLERLKEPSTWRGLFALLTAVGLKLHPEMQEAILTTGLALIGMINVVRKESNDTKPASNSTPVVGDQS